MKRFFINYVYKAVLGCRINLQFSHILYMVLSMLFIVNSDAICASVASVNKIEAVVNNDVITTGDIDKRVAVFKKHGARVGDKMQIIESKLRREILNSYINTVLQRQQAKNLGLSVSDREVDIAVTNIAKSNSLTLHEFKNKLIAENINFQEFKDNIKEQMLLSKLQQHFFAGKIEVSDDEINDVLKAAALDSKKQQDVQYHVLDFLFQTEDTCDDKCTLSVKKIAENFATDLNSKTQPEDITILLNKYRTMAKDYLIKDIDLGWRKINELPNLFTATVERLKIGKSSDGVIAPNGIHILTLREVTGNKTNIKLTKDQAISIVFQHKLAKQVDLWVNELRENSYIKIISDQYKKF